MVRHSPLILLTIVFMFVSMSLPGTAYLQQGAACDGCSLVQDALKASDGLKPGMSRKDVEAQFEPDGGIQTGGWGRYVFRRCRAIKIEARFTGADEGTGAAMLPTDRVLGLSRPYLEVPFAD
jgi:hypothetical protein